MDLRYKCKSWFYMYGLSKIVNSLNQRVEEWWLGLGRGREKWEVTNQRWHKVSVKQDE